MTPVSRRDTDFVQKKAVVPFHADRVSDYAILCCMTGEPYQHLHVALREEAVIKWKYFIGRECLAFQTPQFLENMWNSRTRQCSHILDEGKMVIRDIAGRAHPNVVKRR